MVQFHETFTAVNRYGRRYIYCPRAISRVQIRAISLLQLIAHTKVVTTALTFHKSSFLQWHSLTAVDLRP